MAFQSQWPSYVGDMTPAVLPFLLFTVVHVLTHQKMHPEPPPCAGHPGFRGVQLGAHQQLSRWLLGTPLGPCPLALGR